MRSPGAEVRRFQWLLFIGAGGVLLLLGVSALVADGLTARKRPPYPEPPPSAALEPVRLRTADRQAIGAWYQPGRVERAMALLLHGSGGDRGDWKSLAGFLAREGIGVMMITFRAHGDSTGERNDLGYGGRWDVLAAVDFIEKRHPGRPVVLVGFSLGAAAALFAAKTLGGRVRGYVLESPYPDLATALDNRMRIYLPWPLDRLAFWGVWTAGHLFPPPWPKLSPEEAIRELPGGIPVLFLAGEADRRATPADVRRLQRRVRGRTRLELFPGAVHGQAAKSDPGRYWNSVLEWVRLAEKSE